MVTEPLTLDPSDPLHAFAGLPLLPRTVRVQSEASTPSGPNDLESIHQFMKSMGLRNAEKLLEESKAIVDNGSELLNANFPRFKASLGLDDHVAAKVEKEKPRERRPGLGRKRARFSMKPDTSQPNISLESSLNVDQLQDPEEYFLACEKLENAKQEINRQMGVVAVDSNINDLPTTARRRRPGILGKSVRYKHRFSSVPPDDNDTVMSSQETLKQDDLCALKSDLQQENSSHDVELEELELTGLITEQESRVNAVLDELLSRDTKDLDGVLSLLQEQFQMKPPDLSALCIPDFPAPRTDYMTLGERIPKARKSVLGLQNSEKSTSGERQREESPQSNLTSPTPPKSPFYSLALLRKQILKSNPLRDPFSPINIDLNDINKNSNQVGSVKEFSKSGNLHGECNIKGMKVLDMSHSDHQVDRSVEKNVHSNIDISHSGSHAQMGDHGGHTDVDHMIMRGLEHLNNEQSLEKNSGGETIAVGQSDSHGSMERCNGWNHMDIRTADGNSGMQNRETDVQSSGRDSTDKQDACIFMQGVSPAQVQVEADDTTNTSNETETDIQNNVSSRMDEHVEDMPSVSEFSAEQEHNANDAYTSENRSGNQNPSDQSNSAAVQDHSMDMQSALPDINPEQHIMKHPSTKKQPRKNSSPRGNRERKALKFRPSLADAGMLFENGVRRSKRIKSRPLEYWKGERLLFGRVNESMKLVGVKYISPSVGNMKVKSYISDEYKEVVNLAARY